MSTAATPTTPSQLTSDQLTVIVAAFSGLVFFVVILVLLSIYRKEPHCCKDTHGDMSGQLFLIGLPSSYRLPSLEAPLPRLPSYESVRKKDRQRQIHMMIADRFGLNGSMLTEPPPTYEESIRHSIEVPSDILGSVIDAPHPQNIYPPHPGTDLTTQSEVTTQCPSTQDANSATLPV
ncbi:uncharacterized protein [Oncorhynchus clarkii lewisi]|uniref:uncharacterized protein isoform X2 n=1 Tax=Oncorhynchus clarkii lewisi TaxID=490388 RepID=UPI0039B96D4F